MINYYSLITSNYKELYFDLLMAWEGSQKRVQELVFFLTTF